MLLLSTVGPGWCDSENINGTINDNPGAAASDTYTGVGASATNIVIEDDSQAVTALDGDATSSRNILLGSGLFGTSISNVDDNIAIGEGIFNGAMSASNQNICMGYQPCYSITSADETLAIGEYAAYYLTTGRWNIMLGSNTGVNLTTGESNVAIGYYTGYEFGDGDENVAVGGESCGTGGSTWTAGADGNTCIGKEAGWSLSGQPIGNTIIGWLAGQDQGAFDYSIFIGTQADTPVASTGISNFLNIGNLIYGDGVGTTAHTPGLGRVAVNLEPADFLGSFSVMSQDATTATVAIKRFTAQTADLFELFDADGTTNIGMTIENDGELIAHSPWKSQGSYNNQSVYIGADAVGGIGFPNELSNNSGTVVIGQDAWNDGNQKFQGADYNVVIGWGAMAGGGGVLNSNPVTADDNICIGDEACYDWYDGASSNVSIGSYSLTQASGLTSENTCVGYQACDGTFHDAGNTDGGTFNTFIGSSAGAAANVSGDDNTGIGHDSSGSLSTGSYNNGQGAYTNRDLTTGSYNVSVGNEAGYQMTTGSYNTHLGSSTNRSNSANHTGDYNLTIGYGAEVASGSPSHQMNIANIIYGAGVVATGTTNAPVDGKVGIGAVASELTDAMLTINPYDDADEGLEFTWNSATQTGDAHVIRDHNGVTKYQLTKDGGVRPAKVTADPCGTFPEGTLFYNDTSNYFCYCDGTNDVQMHSPATACF
jgi:hypothetical protein